ncbi:hypothetical protein [Sediminibacillus massiliensis]|uniref:hypothetical protein n=1 Tax=Sediminibacillus massiliensis TaxID=1926277 RepID=UPI0015C40578|nr:hypothetical protein [Sediminibacillus massiliensis]
MNRKASLISTGSFVIGAVLAFFTSYKLVGLVFIFISIGITATQLVQVMKK